MNLADIVLFLVKLLAGTGIFLVGVHLLTENIEQLATGKIRDLFGRTADKRLVNVGIGAGTTALIQSSGVTTVLIVGFVNVGIINLSQATAMIMGANIGTTITAQIAALSAFPITTYIQVFVFIGIMMTMVCKLDHVKKIGFILAGLGLIFVGLGLMSDAMKANRGSIQILFESVSNPFLLLFIGAFLTALVQSSSATTSVIIAMSVAGLTIGSGGNEVLFIILGTNIGSCVTALMSSLGAGANAKRASFIHLLFNTFGSVIFFVILLCWPSFMEETFQRWFPTAATQIAMFHTFFNLTCTILFLPLSDVFVKISTWIIREKAQPKPVTWLDERLYSSPSLALQQLEKESLLLSDVAMGAFRAAFSSFSERDVSLIAPAREQMDQANGIYRNMINFLVRLSSQSGLAEEKQISDLHSSLGDIMRVSEIADNFTKYARQTTEEKLDFSPAGRQEIDEMEKRVEDLYGLTRRVLEERDPALLPEIDQAEDQIDAGRKRLIENHIRRLQQGDCSADCSGVFINLVSNLERLGDHLTYIAYTAAGKGDAVVR